MKTIIIGGSHGGIQTALTLKKVKPKDTVIVYERNDFISFIASGINLYLKGAVKKLADAQLFKEKEVAKAGVDLKKRHEITAVDFAEKRVEVKNLATNQVSWESYDSLVLAMGSTQKSVELSEESDGDFVKTYKSFAESQTLLAEIEAAESITIVGTGYIGVELACTFCQIGKGHKINLIESGSSILNRYYEEKLVASVETVFKENNVKLLLNDTVFSVAPLANGKKLVKTTKTELESDLIIYAINGRPNTGLLEGQMITLPDHTIKVNEYMETSVPDVYAVGDLVAYPVTNVRGRMYTPLVNETVRTANVAAMKIAGMPVKYQANQRTTFTKVCGRYLGSIGMTVKQADFEGRDYKTFLYETKDGNGELLQLFLVFDEVSYVVLGAQVTGSENLNGVIDYLSLVINRQVTVEELVTMDCAFHPEINLPYHFINEAALRCMQKQLRRR